MLTAVSSCPRRRFDCTRGVGYAASTAPLARPHRIAGYLLAGTLILASPRAQASGSGDYSGLFETVLWVELAVPDTRIELEDSTPFVTFSLPLPHLDAHHLFGSTSARRRDFWPSLFVEPQLRPMGPEVRLVAGSRLRWRGVPVFAETAGVAGTDGVGGALGGGLLLSENEPEGGLFGLVYRYTWTHESRRHDVSLDICYLVL